MKFILLLFTMMLSGMMFTGCTKEDDTPPANNSAGSGKLEVRLFHQVNGSSLQMDSIMYTNAAGYPYSVTKLQYYLDSIRLISNGRIVQAKGTFWVDARNATTSIVLDSIPTGNYTAIEFVIGVRPSLNIPNGLPTAAENLKMVWPTEIGGGYHFLMLEGHYRDTTSKTKGYTLHLGTSQQLVNHNIIPVTLSMEANKTTTLNLGMQVDEWYTHPYTYDFAVSGNHIMGIDSCMQKIRDNGKDVFKTL